MTFKPAKWLTNPHAQTLWPVLCRRSIKNFSLTRERVELPDSDFVDLDWSVQEPSSSFGSSPVVLILHGLEGSVLSSYAKGMLRAIQQCGWRGVLMHFRSCSGEYNRLPRLYHSGDTADVDYVVNLIHKRIPTARLAAIGFSLGGNVLLKWLGETAENNVLSAAVAISTPFELHKSAARISKGFSRLYQRYLLNHLLYKIKCKFRYQASPFSMTELDEIKTIVDFDNKITAPLHGFVDAMEYYLKSSCRQYLKTIRVPTLLLQAQDDPFMTNDLLPFPHELSESVHLELTKNGGHVGFVSGSVPFRPQYWLEERTPLFLKEYLL